MVRLGLRLTLSSGREAFTRLLLTTAAVTLGVAVLLGVLAEFHAFQAGSNRSCWECTQGAAVPKALPSRGELWNYSVDYYQGRTIERLDLAALGPGAPVPPGASRLPGPGQYYASPALAALLRSVPRDELGDRFPGTMAGTIGRPRAVRSRRAGRLRRVRAVAARRRAGHCPGDRHRDRPRARRCSPRSSGSRSASGCSRCCSRC